MKTILLIEDNPDMRENTAEILELAQYKVLTAADGKEGVIIAQREKPNLIVCDIMMPELDGYGVLSVLGKHSATASIPFIFLSAKAEKSDQRLGMSMGADDYLTKPFENTELLLAVEVRLKKMNCSEPDTVAQPRDYLNFLNRYKALIRLLHYQAEKKKKFSAKKMHSMLKANYPGESFLLQRGKLKPADQMKTERSLLPDYLRRAILLDIHRCSKIFLIPMRR